MNTEISTISDIFSKKKKINENNRINEDSEKTRQQSS